MIEPTTEQLDKERRLEDMIRVEVQQKFDDTKRLGFALQNSHFENGVSLHSSQYYFAKRYFQETNNCEKLADLLCSKLIRHLAVEKPYGPGPRVGLKKPTTLVGYRNYSALVLNRVVKKLRLILEGTKFANDINYAIIEKENDEFTWQYAPDLKEELLIVLPITCTCTTFFKIRRYLQERYPNDPGGSNVYVKKEFITVFLIIENSLQDPSYWDAYNNRSVERSMTDTEIQILNKLTRIYEPFNWNEISDDKIKISTGKAMEFDMTSYAAYPLVRLYSELHLPEECPYCFPKQSTSIELPLIPTHDNYETPNLIFGFPNFARTSNEKSFVETFVSGEETHDVQLRGNIFVDGIVYTSFIRGNAFYEKNRSKILQFFDTKISGFFEKEAKNSTANASVSSSNVVFITCESKHSSGFLEGISRTESLRNLSVTILRFLPTNEFIDNFISLHGKLIVDPNTKVFYFEEVMSAGKTFKLISNYIKHARSGNTVEQDDVTEKSVHGFDLVLTLVNRMLPYTKREVKKKLLSERNKVPSDHLISYFNLNVPILTASHMDDGTEGRRKQLEAIIDRSNLDSFKATIGNQIAKRTPIQLPELDGGSSSERILDYFPFGKLNSEEDKERYRTYKPYFKKERLDLLHLHVVHELNNVLAGGEYQSGNLLENQPYKSRPEALIEELVSKVLGILKDDLPNYFISPEFISGEAEQASQSEERNIEAETEIVHDIVIKALSQPRFIYYQNIYRPIFHYCIGKLTGLIDSLPGGLVENYPTLRKLKFYLRRSVDLNSNFMFSEKFMRFIEGISNMEYIERTIKTRTAIGLKFVEEKDENDSRSELAEFKTAVLNNIRYRIDEINSFFPTLHYYYKELLFNSPARSLKLEALINSCSRPDIERNLEDLLADSYFQFMDMARTENVGPLAELVKLHKKNLHDSKQKIFDLEQTIAICDEKASLLEAKISAEQHTEPISSKVEENGRYQNELAKVKKNRNAAKEAIRAAKIDEPDTILNYYFHKTLNDPIILHARKLLAHTLNPKRIGDLQLSAARALATVGILEKRYTGDYAKKRLNEELKEILDSALSILKSDELTEPLNYALFVEYRNNPKPIDEDFAEVYSYIKDEDENDPSRVILRRNGLAFSLLNGLFGEQKVDFNPDARAGKLGNEQTLIAGIKRKDGKFMSFKNTYILRSEGKTSEISYAELLENDFYDKKIGVEILKDANMVIALRLADFVPPTDTDDKFSLQGRAVLLITRRVEATTVNFLKFFNTEKIRLLLLIKQDLLRYLERQVENEVFLNEIEVREEKLFKRHLRHGMKPYLETQRKLVSGVESFFNASSDPAIRARFKDNFDLYSLVHKAILGQLEPVVDEQTPPVSLNEKIIGRIVQLLFPSGTIGAWSIDPGDLKISGFNSEAIYIHQIILAVIIPELLVNMKKHCPRDSEAELSIDYLSEEGRLSFSNRKKKASNEHSHVGQGLNMCNSILGRLNLPKIECAEDEVMFTATIRLKK